MFGRLGKLLVDTAFQSWIRPKCLYNTVKTLTGQKVVETMMWPTRSNTSMRVLCTFPLDPWTSTVRESLAANQPAGQTTTPLPSHQGSASSAAKLQKKHQHWHNFVTVTAMENTVG